MTSDRWLSIAELMDYSGLSRDTLTRAMTDPDDPLPSSRVYATVRVRLSDFEAWMLRRRRVGTPEAAAPDIRRMLARITNPAPRVPRRAIVKNNRAS